MVSASVIVVLVIATILGITNAQERRRPSIIGAIRNGIAGITNRGNNINRRGGRQPSVWGQQDVIVGTNQASVNQFELQHAITECEQYQQCALGYICVLNQFQDGLECYNDRTGHYDVMINTINQRHIQSNNGGFVQGFNNGFNRRSGVSVGGQIGSVWQQPTCCLKPRPQECIPRLSYGRRAVAPNMIRNDFWTFDNGQCRQQPILSRFIDQIGQNAAYGNFFPSQRDCFDRCDRPRLHTQYASCYQARPAACIPPVDCASSLIADNYFRYDVNSRACVQTSLLQDHVSFIGQRDEYSNFFNDRTSCISTCPQDAWEFQNY